MLAAIVQALTLLVSGSLEAAVAAMHRVRRRRRSLSPECRQAPASAAIYPRLGQRRASLEPKTYRLLRELGFDGYAVADSLGVFGSPYAPYWRAWRSGPEPTWC